MTFRTGEKRAAAGCRQRRLRAGAAMAAAILAAVAVSDPSAAEPGNLRSIAQRPADIDPNSADFELYLDRLMLAESDGRDFLKNPRSSALGPYQFIQGTFLHVVRRRFSERVAGLSTSEILALRTDRAFAREVIAEYSRELARHLDRHGLAATYGNLRLAYLIGPSGATRVLSAKPETALARLISDEAIAANPFLSGMTAADIIARAHRDISMDRNKRLAVVRDRKGGVSDGHEAAKIKVRCNLARPSCRRWLALRKNKLRKQAAVQ
ncbi:MAG: hypothetical protein KJ587_05895 [Alphaproteobacteria bacterium]|nr:hypothetical protein [Alphaproteobacteria bacterium]